MSEISDVLHAKIWASVIVTTIFVAFIWWMLANNTLVNVTAFAWFIGIIYAMALISIHVTSNLYPVSVVKKQGGRRK